MKKLIILFTLLLAGHQLMAQEFTLLDTLRGSVTEDRAWWDLNYYHLDIEVLPDDKVIKGSVEVQYTVLEDHEYMQIDLQEPMKITKITQNDVDLEFTRLGPVHTIHLLEAQNKGDVKTLMIQYEGKPREAVRAPWDGGVSWKKDKNGEHFIATSCQSLGASVWWPCKDHMYDEVDSMLISVEVPEQLTNVSNGRLRSVKENKSKKTKTFVWFVANPINNYGVNINIADYYHWNEKYDGEKGELDLDYWVLSYNKKVAREQFKQGAMTIEAFEYWMGPYPFYEDGYKLVEVPYLGMEHQSSVTYGNGYQNGYRGMDRSGTGWGLKFDYIIIHETGHEWFANNITYIDEADMWVHEGFTTYSESLYLDYWFGKEAGEEYLRTEKRGIKNVGTVIGPYDVNKRGEDVYDKGATILGMVRQMINDDEKWRSILRGLGEEFYHQTVRTGQVEEYITKQSGLDLKPFFDQFLRTTSIPTLEYFSQDGVLAVRWMNCIEGFQMPVDIIIDGVEYRINPTSEWSALELNGTQLSIHPNYYLGINKLF